MSRTLSRSGGIALTLAVALAVAIATIGVRVSDRSVTFDGKQVTPREIERGEALYATSCASCHGTNLEGQADWKRRLDSGRMPAPPHDESGHTWHHSDRDLFTMTKRGVDALVPGYESDMPAFGGALSDAEITAVLAYIKSRWSERERVFQAEVTANDGGRP